MELRSQGASASNKGKLTIGNEKSSPVLILPSETFKVRIGQLLLYCLALSKVSSLGVNCGDVFVEVRVIINCKHIAKFAVSIIYLFMKSDL